MRYATRAGRFVFLSTTLYYRLNDLLGSASGRGGGLVKVERDPGFGDRTKRSKRHFNIGEINHLCPYFYLFTFFFPFFLFYSSLRRYTRTIRPNES